jgi:hypothetical protein
MIYRKVHLGFSTADAAGVELRLRNSELELSFTQWNEEIINATFQDVLAFKWENELDDSTLRDDGTYQVEGSTWLKRQAGLQDISDISAYAHYKLCFNSVGVLDMLCRQRGA